ncbi:MAG: tail fiber protein [Mucilaginibacter sp.]
MDAYVGEIAIFSFNTIPSGWMQCNGQQININTNQALYALIGYTYGGDQKTYFNLPNLQGTSMLGIGAGNGLNIQYGNKGGVAQYTLLTPEMPLHNHGIAGVNDLAAAGIGGGANFLAQLSLPPVQGTGNYAGNLYTSSPTPVVAMDPGNIGISGANAAHENRMPYTALNVCICVQGYFPPRN